MTHEEPIVSAPRRTVRVGRYLLLLLLLLLLFLRLLLLLLLLLLLFLLLLFLLLFLLWVLLRLLLRVGQHGRSDERHRGDDGRRNEHPFQHTDAHGTLPEQRFPRARVKVVRPGSAAAPAWRPRYRTF